jgi:hypothetical protein
MNYDRYFFVAFLIVGLELCVVHGHVCIGILFPTYHISEAAYMAVGSNLRGEGRGGVAGGTPKSGKSGGHTFMAVF